MGGPAGAGEGVEAILMRVQAVQEGTLREEQGQERLRWSWRRFRFLHRSNPHILIFPLSSSRMEGDLDIIRLKYSS